MKKIKNILLLLAGVLVCSCSEDTFMPFSVTEGEEVTLSLNYKDIAPHAVNVGTRAATEADEKHLDNLQVFIFGADGKLKGYKQIEGEENLSQNGAEGSVNIQTTMGESYIYAIANSSTNNYTLDGSLPSGLTEDAAQKGEVDFTRDQFKSLLFKRGSGAYNPTDNRFLMSGVLNETSTGDAGACTIVRRSGDTGSVTVGEGEDNVIRLRRVVSKVVFNISVDNPQSKIFTLNDYDIMNVSSGGGLVKGTKPATVEYENFDGWTDDIVTNADGSYTFTMYLPENAGLTPKASLTADDDKRLREADYNTTPKEFINAPEYGTYIVLNGRYQGTGTAGESYDATTHYTIHLGDLTTDINDYDLDRNYRYTYNVKVKGVNDIIVNTEKENEEENPGAEGVVFEFGSSGKTFMLDSHYEYCVMRFYQRDIKALRGNGSGYIFRVNSLNNNGVMSTTGDIVVTNKADADAAVAATGVNIDWIEFDEGGTYDDSNAGRGEGVLYDGPTKTLSMTTLLAELYDNANNDSYWDEGSGDNRYRTYTCFVSENYYENFTWDKYVNQERTFYVANEVRSSTDGRSTYAQVAYSVSQYPIRTFYDTNSAGELIAYGCETINDEEYAPKGIVKTTYNDGGNSNRYDAWNGRKNTIRDIGGKLPGGALGTYPWWRAYQMLNEDLYLACISRNRDINGNGTLDPEEIRWYTPTNSQYAGLIIGESALGNEAKLYSKGTVGKNGLGGYESPDRSNYMHYLSSTRDTRTVWSEEGFACGKPEDDGGYTQYVRCVRNLQSNGTGVGDGSVDAVVPDKYYNYDATNRRFTLNGMDSRAVSATQSLRELGRHSEEESTNKPSSSFEIGSLSSYANDRTKGVVSGVTMDQVTSGSITCSRNLGTGWRVPNQRELMVMFLCHEDGTVSNLFEGTSSSPGYYFCKTHYTNTNYRQSWSVNAYSKIIWMMNPSQSSSINGLIRCIKDTATDD